MLSTNINGSIAVGSSQSDAIQTNEYVLTGMVFTGSIAVTGSQVSFLVSPTGANYYPLFDYTGTEVTVPVSASSRAYNLNNSVFEPWNYIKLRLGFTGSSVNQATYALPIVFVASK